MPGGKAQVEPSPRPSAIEDRWILSRLQEIVADTAARIEDYDFSHAALGLYDFVYGELCDWYLELGQAAARPERDVAQGGAPTRDLPPRCSTCCARLSRSRTR